LGCGVFQYECRIAKQTKTFKLAITKPFSNQETLFLAYHLTQTNRIWGICPTFGEFVPRLGISATFGKKFGELRYLGIF